MSLTQFLRKKLHDPNQLSLLLDLFTLEKPEPVTATSPAAPSLSAPAQSSPVIETARPTTPTPLASGFRRLKLPPHVLDYRLQRSKRRTIGFQVSEEGLRVTAPRWVTVVEIEAAIAEKQQWIFNKLNEQRERSVRRLQPPMQWRDGATLPYLGMDVTLRLDESGNVGIRFNAESRELFVSLPASAGEQQLKDRVLGWLQGQAKLLFAERLEIYADKLAVRFQRFALSSATTQWGSCTADGRIRLNWRLMHFALPNIDYVIAHELSHLREMNHGPEFWATVQSVLPEFEAARKALKNYAPESLPIF
jgi:predicted metal-dependent hydrolase